MEKLNKYYGDTKKVIQACVSEIKSHPLVQSFDYKGSISLKTCIENNHMHLKCRKLEHKMSNTSSMEFILKKFPIQENIEWSKHLSKSDPSIQEQSFDEIIKWLNGTEKAWELLAATGTGVTGVKSGGRGNFFVGSDGNIQCYGCGEIGHMK